MTATAPVHAEASATEKAAAKRASRFAETLEGRVLAAVVQAGDQGLTAREAREALGLPVEKQYSVSPRLSALKRKGWVEPMNDVVRADYMAYTVTAAGRAQAERAA